MQTIQVVVDEKLLRETDRAARRLKENRSALIRRALQEHLRRLKVQELEERDQKGYALRPQDVKESQTWESIAEWPED